MTSIKISLHDLKIFGYHGVHREENIAGAEFLINMDICYETSEEVRSLDQTIDYTGVYTIIRNQMQVPFTLLETLGMEIADQTKRTYPLVSEINITISKINPPLINFRGQLGVSIHKRY